MLMLKPEPRRREVGLRADLPDVLDIDGLDRGSSVTARGMGRPAKRHLATGTARSHTPMVTVLLSMPPVMTHFRTHLGEAHAWQE